MKMNFLAFIFSLSLLKSIITEEEQKKEVKTLVLNDSNFHEYKEKYENLLVYFSASWNEETPERKELISNINQEVDQIKEKENEKYIIMGEVDSKNYNTSHLYDVQKYPSLILIEGPKHMKYKGPFELERIMEWLNHLLDKQIIKLNTYEEIEARTENHQSIVLFYGDSEKNRREYDLYYNISGFHHLLHFYHFTNSSILKHFNTTLTITEPTIIIHKIHDELINVYNGSFTESDLKHFIDIYSRPVLSDLDSDSYMYIMNEKKTFIALLLDDNDESSTALEEVFYATSIKYRASIMAFVGNIYTTLTREFNIKKAELPVMVIEEFNNGKSNRKYKSKPSDLQNNGIEEFYKSFFANKLQKYLKSENIADYHLPNLGNIKYLVGNNFENFILNEEKWVLVFFTRRKCSICDEFLNDFKLLSDHYSSNSHILFALINGELNELEHIDIKSFPTIILFPKGNEKYKKMIKFEQIAHLDNLKNFVEYNIPKEQVVKRDDL